MNIIYLRSGERASDRWDDRRLVIRFENEQPKIVGDWAATVQPGDPATFHGRKDGAFHINLGQYTAWRVGLHQGLTGSNPHEALVQVAPIDGKRDSNKSRVPDKPVRGLFGINQHGSQNSSLRVGRSSYGCLVAKGGIEAHREFMKLLKADPRYQNNRNFLFTTAILNFDDL